MKIMMMQNLLMLILAGSLMACNGTSTSEKADNDENAERMDTDTLPFEVVEDTLEVIIEETGEVQDTIQSKKTNTTTDSNIKNGSQKTSDPMAEVRKKLVGSWKWEKTKCCGRNAQWYTDTLQENRVLKFTADGFVETYHRGILQSKEQYKLEKGPIYEERPHITIGKETHGPALLDLENGEMIINYGYMDLQIEYYKRVK